MTARILEGGMEEKTFEEERLCDCVENQGGECEMNSTFVNKEYEIVTAVSDNFFCENITAETFEIDDSKESLESFYEYPEAIDSKWIENVQNDTSALGRWREHSTGDFQNIKGQAFVQCPLLHPHEDLHSANRDRNADLENQHFVALETTLSRISKVTGRDKLECLRVGAGQKFNPDVKNKGSFPHGVPPDVALENYCQQHAYSRARLLRTDRRALANELLERMAMKSAQVECVPTLISETSQSCPRPFNMPTAEKPRPVLHTACYEKDRNDCKQPHSGYSFSSRTANAISRLNKDCEQSRNPGGREHKTIWRKAPADELHEPFKITPCVLMPSRVPSESRNRIFRRN